MPRLNYMPVSIIANGTLVFRPCMYDLTGLDTPHPAAVVTDESKPRIVYAGAVEACERFAESQKDGEYLLCVKHPFRRGLIVRRVYPQYAGNG